VNDRSSPPVGQALEGLVRPALLLTLVAVVCAAAAPGAFPEDRGALSRPLSVDLIDVPLTGTLEVLAAHVGVTGDYRESADAQRRVSLQLTGASAEVVLVLLAWETDTEWLLADGVLHWGSAEALPAEELARSRRERAARLGRVSAVLLRRLAQSVPFRLKAQGVKVSDLLRFLERECSVPFLLDARCGETLETTVEQDFEGVSLTELLNGLLASEPFADSLDWTVVGEAVVVSTPERVRSLRALLR